MKKFLISLLCTVMIFASVTPISAETSKDALNALIQEALLLDEEKYSNATYSILEDKIRAGQALEENASQAQIDAAASDITNAMNDLLPRHKNLALNKTVTASSTYPDARFDKAFVTDGDLTTRWGNHYNSQSYKNGNHEEHITVDLGAKYSIDTVSIEWEHAHATSYTIQGSNNGTDFFNIKEVSGKGNTEIHTDLGDVTLRYVRIAMHKALNKYGYSIWELEVYEQNPNTTIYNNLALNKEASASSTFSGDEYALDHLNDGNSGTRWQTNYHGDLTEEFVVVDLGGTYQLDRIILNYEAAYAKKYKIQGSIDGTNYVDITNELTGAAGENRLLNLNASARYVKIEFIEAATNYGYSLYELEVYGPRKNDLKAVYDQLKEKLETIEIGTTDGTMSEDDYQDYVTLSESAKAVIDNENSKVIDIYSAIEAVNAALLTIDDDIISGMASASIYPVPQNMVTNSNNGMKFKGIVDVLVHGDQDEATLPKLEALLESQDITYQYVDALGTNAAIILANQCDKADCDICTSVADSENALQQVQGYVLDSSNEVNEKGQVTIVGADADGVYYGVMSLIQIFKQKTTDGRIAEVTISDYPDVEFRGYVEGFYGIPWTFDDRANLFKDTSLYKMTTYIYAPKDDPYHRKSWRTLYPEAESNNIKALAEVAAENNMEFCWTIHPGADYDYTTDADGNGIVDDYEKIIAKFEQVYSLGVRQFGVFYDDLSYSVANGVQHSTVINNAYEYLTSKYDDVKPFITVVTRYTNSWGAPWDTYFTPFMQNIHEDTIVLWTGQATMSAITKDYMEYPQTKTGVDRDLGVWWNFPVTDYYYGHLLMGSLDCLSNDVDNINSFFLNPMSEADASKVAIYSGADYSWNTQAFDSTASWKRAIKELVPECNEAFERFADNLAYVSKGNGFFFDESKYLIDDLENFNKALSDGLTIDDVHSLKAEFELMLEDVEQLRKIKNTALAEEVEQFLNGYTSLAEAGIAAMNAFEAALNGQISETISNINLIDEKILESSSYRIKKLSGTAPVSVGVFYQIAAAVTDIVPDSRAAVVCCKGGIH